MTLFNTVVLGLVEGFTEFLPISSTAHLILTARVLGIEQTPFTSLFEVVIQSGAIGAVAMLYYKLILKNRRYTLLVFTSFIPTAIAGIIFYDVIKQVFFHSITLISASLFLVGTLFIVIEYVRKRYNISLNKDIVSMPLLHALIIGIFQSFAIVPGVSRAGAVIIAMILLRYKRSEAVIYSFLLAVPTIIGASVFDILETDPVLITNNVLLILVGMGISFVSALIAIKTFIRFIQNNTLVLFGWYRILLALITMLFLC